MGDDSALENRLFESNQFSALIESVSLQISKTAKVSLPPDIQFSGSGVYIIYYSGEFPGYELNRNFDRAIYVGKAVPPGWRTARGEAPKASFALYGRLREHAKSISCAVNLSLEDFSCRYLVFGEGAVGMISTVESALISSLRPVWNSGIDGFGNHDPGKGRYGQAKSDWDVLHPGRPWVSKLVGESRSESEVLGKLKSFNNGEAAR